MNDKEVTLTSNEQSSLTEILLTEKTDRIKHNQDYAIIDSVLTKVSDRVAYVKKLPPHVSLFNGTNYFDIYAGGIFENEHGKFKVKDIKGNSLLVNGKLRPKSEFEPAFVLKEKGKTKGLCR